MAGSGTRRSTKKSRGGCSRCKAQHIKCDEAKPHCGRCERLGLKCPGYATQLKWSTKHEVHLNGENANPRSLEAAAGEYDWLEFSLPPATPAFMDSPTTPDSSNDNAFIGPSAGDELSVEPLIDIWNAPNGVLEPEMYHSHDLQLSSVTDSHVNQRQPLLQALGARRREMEPRLPMSLTNQPYELISYYFKVVPGVYSTFDNHKNPFRSAVSGLYSHSLVVNLAAQSMAAVYLAEVHPRFAELGVSLRRQCLDLVQAESNNNYDVLLALMMSGPTGNWHDPSDLGLPYFETMSNRLAAVASTGKLDSDFRFFSEAMILWEMFLAFASDSSQVRRWVSPSPLIDYNLPKREVHPWTGVGGDTLYVIAEIGRLVRANRIRSQAQKFVTQNFIQQMSQDLAKARELENRLLNCIVPDDKDVANTEDNATPVWHITTIAELHRYAGLLQLYRVFPDLLSERLQNGVASQGALTQLPDSDMTEIDHDSWLRTFAMEALRQLETIPLGSGTIDFQPFLLVVFASELACGNSASDNDIGSLETVDQSKAVSARFADVAIMRKFIVDRLTSFCRQIPPKPLRVCLDIIQETWRRIDDGKQNVYWLDVMIEKGWETIMA